MARRHGFQVAPTSRALVRRQAAIVRGIAECGPHLPVVELIDVLLPKKFPGFLCVYLSIADMIERFGPGVEGMTFPDQGEIYIREDVYLKALNEDGRSRFSIAHELGHLFLHHGIGLARRTSEDTPIYCNSEWQADTFAGELLVDFTQVEPGSSVQGLMSRFGVSHEAGRAMWSQLRAEGML